MAGLVAMLAVSQAVSAIDWASLKELKFDAATEFPEMVDHFQDYVSEHLLDLTDPATWLGHLETFAAQEAVTFAGNHHLMNDEPDVDDSLLANGEPDPGDIDALDIIPDDLLEQAPVAFLESIQDSIAENLGDTGAAALAEGVLGGIPILTSLKSSFREINLLKNDETEIASALKNSCLDIAGTGAGFAAGAKVGGAIGSVIPGAGTAAGATLGGILGAFAGRSTTEKLKVAKFVESVKVFQAQLPVCAANVEAIKESGRLQLIGELEHSEQAITRNLECIAADLQSQIDLAKANVSVHLQQIPDVFVQALIRRADKLEKKRVELLSASSSSALAALWPTEKSVFLELAIKWIESAQATIQLTISTFTGAQQSLNESAPATVFINRFVQKYEFSDSRLAEHLQLLEADHRRLLSTATQLRERGQSKADGVWQTALHGFKEKSIQVQQSMAQDAAFEVGRVKQLKADVEKEGLKLGKRDLFISRTGPSSTPTSSEEEILALIGALCGDRSGIYINPKIPERKNVSLRKRCSVDPSQRSLVLLDSTVFGSAKNGMLLTDKALWFANDWTCKQSGTYSISYAEFLTRMFAKSGKYEIDLGSGNLFNCAGSGWSPEEIIFILNALKTHLGEGAPA